MTTDGVERVHYYQRQYLGASDFTDEQDYHRDMRRRVNLGSLTWGIVCGLELVEKDQEGGTGAKDIFILPGFARDGFGREIVVEQPYPLDPALFEVFLTKLHQTVWI